MEAGDNWPKDFRPRIDFQTLSIPTDSAILQGKLLQHEGSSKGLILLVQVNGSPSQSPQHDLVSQMLYDNGFSTLRFHLLNEDEERSDAKSRGLRFNITLLTKRLVDATQWISQELAMDQALGCYSSSTGTAAVLRAATVFGQPISAIVSLSGRPDLSGDALNRITTPTLLLAGGQDTSIMDLNACARSRMRPGVVRMEVIPQAGHLFEEEGVLERAARLATQWFEKHVGAKKVNEPRVYGNHARNQYQGQTHTNSAGSYLHS